MPEPKGPNLAKIATLLTLLKEQHDKSAAVIEEINELLGGGPGMAAKIKEVQAAFQQVWSERYRGTYLWRHAVDVPHIKRLVKALGVEEVKIRTFNYLRSDDQFIARSRHPFGLFVSGINGYANAGAASEELELEAPIDCHHTPTCRDEVTHTRKKSAEMRA